MKDMIKFILVGILIGAIFWAAFWLLLQAFTGFVRLSAVAAVLLVALGTIIQQ